MRSSIPFLSQFDNTRIAHALILDRFSRRLVLAVSLVGALAIPVSSFAQLRTAPHAGSACFGYPAYRDDVAIPYRQHLVGLNQGAYCPIRIDDQMQARHLYLVFVYGINITSRVCVHRYGYWVRCGSSRSIGSSRTSTWVTPPSDTPGAPTGAFLDVDFTGAISWIDQYDPLWSIP